MEVGGVRPQSSPPIGSYDCPAFISFPVASDFIYNSFQYWRLPLPQLDLSLLESGSDDPQTKGTSKLKDSSYDPVLPMLLVNKFAREMSALIMSFLFDIRVHLTLYLTFLGFFYPISLILKQYFGCEHETFVLCCMTTFIKIVIHFLCHTVEN
uniref:Uncharacterized protein n=1 Tax=Salarias fasciatus TaxID=181472 RepID=A0A672JP17_SALFA